MQRDSRLFLSLILVPSLSLLIVSPSALAQMRDPLAEASDPLEDAQAVLDDVDQSVGEVGDTVDNLDQVISDGINDAIEEAVTDETAEPIEEAIGIGEQVGSIVEGIESIIAGIQDFFENFDLARVLGRLELPDIFTNAQGGLENEIEQVIGAVGQPDPESAAESIEGGETAALNEVFYSRHGGDGSPVLKENLKMLLDADSAEEAAIESALSEQAQELLQANADVANQALDFSTELAEDSETQDVSQNILRNLSSQALAAQQTDTLLALDAQVRRRDDAHRNVVLANTLRETQRHRAQERQKDAAAHASVMVQGSLFTLPGLGTEE